MPLNRDSFVDLFARFQSLSKHRVSLWLQMWPLSQYKIKYDTEIWFFFNFAIKWHDKQNIFWTQFCPLVKLTSWRPSSSMFFELTDRNSTDPVHYTHNLYKLSLTVVADLPGMSSHAVLWCVTVVGDEGPGETIICFFSLTSDHWVLSMGVILLPPTDNPLASHWESWKTIKKTDSVTLRNQWAPMKTSWFGDSRGKLFQLWGEVMVMQPDPQTS